MNPLLGDVQKFDLPGHLVAAFRALVEQYIGSLVEQLAHAEQAYCACQINLAACYRSMPTSRSKKTARTTASTTRNCYSSCHG